MTMQLDEMNMWPKPTWRAMHSQWIGALVETESQDLREFLFALTDWQLDFPHFMLAALRGRLRVTVHLADDESDGIAILWATRDAIPFRIGGCRLDDAGLTVGWIKANERYLTDKALREMLEGES